MQHRVQTIGWIISSVRRSFGWRMVACVVYLVALSFSLTPSNSAADPQVTAPDAAQSELLRQSIQLYEKVLRESPGTEQAARAQYRLGLAHLQLGEVEKGIAALRWTVTEYPNSPFAPMALEAMATFHQSAGQVDISKAEQNELCNSYPQSMETQKVWRNRGMELLAQASRNDQDPDKWVKLSEAETFFEKILKAAGEGPGQIPPDSELTAEAALRIGYCVLLRDKSKSYSTLQYTDSIRRFESVLTGFPTSRFAPEAIGVLISLHHQQKEANEEKALRERLARDYSKATTAAAVFMRIGYSLWATQRREEAIPYFVRGVLSDPDPQRLRTIGGMLSNAIASPDAARIAKCIESTYRSILGYHVATPYIGLHRAFSLLAQSKSSEALKTFTGLASAPTRPDTHTPTQSFPWDVASVASPEVINHQRDSSPAGGATEQYQSLLQTCGNHGKDFLSARYHLAVALQKSNRLDEAIAQFERVFRDPAKVETCAQAGLTLAKLYKDQGQSDKSLNFLDEVVKRFESLSLASDAQVLRAYLLEVQGKKEDAEKAMQGAVLAHPEDVSFPIALAAKLAELFEDQGNFERAEELLNSIHEGSGSQATDLKAKALLNFADKRRNAGDPENAISSYKSIVKSYGKEAYSVARALLHWGYALGNLGEYEQGVEKFDSVIQRYLNDTSVVAGAWLEKGYFLMKLRRWSAAFESFGKVLTIPRKDNSLVDFQAKALYYRGLCRIAVNDDGGAAKEFQRMIDQYPQALWTPMAWYQNAKIAYRKRGADAGEVIAHAMEQLQLKPQLPYFQALLEDLGLYRSKLDSWKESPVQPLDLQECQQLVVQIGPATKPDGEVATTAVETPGTDALNLRLDTQWLTARVKGKRPSTYGTIQVISLVVRDIPPAGRIDDTLAISVKGTDAKLLKIPVEIRSVGAVNFTPSILCLGKLFTGQEVIRTLSVSAEDALRITSVKSQNTALEIEGWNLLTEGARSSLQAKMRVSEHVAAGAYQGDLTVEGTRAAMYWQTTIPLAFIILERR